MVSLRRGGADADIADVVHAGLVLEIEIADMDIAVEVTVGRLAIVRDEAEVHLRHFAAVEMEGGKVDIADIGREGIFAVLRCGRKGDLAAEEEIEVRIAGDDAAFVEVGSENARGIDLTVAVAGEFELAEVEGIDLCLGAARLELCGQARFRGHVAELFDAENPPEIQPGRTCGAVDDNGGVGEKIRQRALKMDPAAGGVTGLGAQFHFFQRTGSEGRGRDRTALIELADLEVRAGG